MSDSSEDWLTRFLEEEPEGTPEDFAAWAAARRELDEATRAEVALLLAGLRRAVPLAGKRASAPGILTAFFGPESESEPEPDGTSASPLGEDLRPGRRIGRFELKEFLARGGMGQVWLATDTELRRDVALKLILPERVDERGLQLFAREARAGGRLSHPNIITTLDAGSDEGLAWIAQEYVPGSWTLKGYLDRARAAEALPRGYYGQVARLTAELASALQTAHDAGVIHRDVKPANVLITEDDRPKLTDFGLARVSDDSFRSVSGDLAGTFAYMSPEQVRAKRAGLDHRTDVFSLGVVLYELLTLRRPFEGDTTHQVVEGILHNEPPPADALRSQCPGDLAVIAAKAYEKDPARRYGRASELEADLRRFLADEPIQARPPTAAQRMVKRIRRHPTASAVACVGLAALVVVSLLLAYTLGLNAELETQTALAETRRERAVEAADEADAQRLNVLRLSAHREIDELLAEAESLWPPYPALLPELRAWEARARRMANALDAHNAALAELERSALPRAEGEPWAFPDSVEGGAWWHGQLRDLVLRIRTLMVEHLNPEAAWGVAYRVRFAMQMERDFASRGRHRKTWDASTPALVARYPELAGVTPWMGLVPLGPDPVSGLWEFAHVASGAIPSRDADGALAMGAESAIVLTLIPAGSYRIGSQASDPDGWNYDPDSYENEEPVHEVALSPFLIGKYEVTQGQWRRLFGDDPSLYGAGRWSPEYNRDGSDVSPLHPVEGVSWDRAAEIARFGLSLPSEAQWEAACRAGTSTAFWHGEDFAGLARTANVADRHAKKVSYASWQVYEDFDDGYTSHAPVGSFEANPFGLHDVHGNVAEWCADGYDAAAYAEPDRRDPLVDPATSEYRVHRGGSFYYGARSARAAVRNYVQPTAASAMLGLRVGLSWP